MPGSGTSRTLRATRRPSPSSSTMYTVPMPPLPATPARRYLVPARSGSRTAARSRAKALSSSRLLAQQRAGLLEELGLVGRELAQDLEDHAPQVAADPGKPIGHVGHRDAEAVREIAIGRPLAREIVLLEQRVMLRSIRARALLAQPAQRERKDRARPLLVEQHVRRIGRSHQPLDLLLEVVGKRRGTASALLPRGCPVVIRHQPVDAGAQVGAQACAPGIEASQKLLLDQLGEELLRQVGRLLMGAVPAQPQVAVDRPPVHRRQGLDAARSLLCVCAAHQRQGRVPGGRKSPDQVLVHDAIMLPKSVPAPRRTR